MSPSAEYQRVYFRFLLDLTRALAAATRGGPPRPDRMLVLSAVTLGTLEGRPFRIKKLAEYVHMPRTSVLRRLEELEAEGWIEYDQKGHALTRMDRLETAETHAICDRLSTIIHRTHYELVEIERKENKSVQSGH